MQKIKKKNDLLNMRGIHKFWTTFGLETLYIFLVDILAKLILDNLVFDASILRIFLSSCILSLVITLVTTNLPQKLRLVILITFNFIVTFYAWLQVGFLNFLGAFMSLGNAEQGTKITDYIIDFLLSYSPLVHTIFIPFILTNIYFYYERYITKDGFLKKIEFKSLTKDAILVGSVTILTFGYFLTIKSSSMQNKFQTVSNKQLFSYPSNPALAIKNFGMPVYLLLDIKGIVTGQEDIYQLSSNSTNENKNHTRKVDDEAWQSLIKIEDDENFKVLNNYFINKNISDTNEYTGMFKDKNLIMIMLESVSEVVFHEEYKEYFPTLYKLYKEGMTGVNNYSPRNNCATGESEMTSQISLYSIPTTCTINAYKMNEYRQALMHMLNKNGYYTSAYHDFTDHYYSRSTVEYKWGSSKYYDVNDLDIYTNKTYREWPSDIEFMQKAVPKFIDKNKFASYMITVSSHHPYMYASEIGDKYLDMFEDLDISTSSKRYLSKIKEVDLALEDLLKQLEDSEKLKDTVLVIFGDHYPYSLNNKEFVELTGTEDTLENNEVDRTPFIIYNSGTEPMTIEKYTSPLDYTPTILNLFGVDFDPRYYMGHDIFSEYEDYVVFSDNSWQSSNGFYSASKGEFIPAPNKDVLSDDKIISINKEIDDMRNMSALAIKKNYFEHLFQYFDEYAGLSSKDTNLGSNQDNKEQNSSEEDN